MSEILVVVDHAEGAVKKPTYEMLTLAARLGDLGVVRRGPEVDRRRLTEPRREGQHLVRRLLDRDPIGPSNVVDDNQDLAHVTAPLPLLR